MAHDQLFIYRRNDEHDSWLIIANFSNEALAIPEELDTTGQTVIENEPDLLAEGKIPAYGAIVIDQ